jgi:hypothetical protein
VTLSPGLQYLTNTERKSVMSGKEKCLISDPRPLGIFSTKWKEYQRWAKANPLLADNWVRIAAISQIPTVKDYEAVYKVFPKKIEKNKEKIEYFKSVSSMLISSPLFLITFNSENG